MSAISTIRNMGPKMSDRFARVGITTSEEVRELGLDEAYTRLLSGGMTTHFMVFWALAAGLEDRWYNTYSDDEKARLRMRHTELIAATKPNARPAKSEVDAFMDQIGLTE